MKIDNRFVLFTILLSVFVLWLGFFGYFIFFVLGRSADYLDPAMALFSGMGLGTVTGFLIAMLTLSWQFYFRKKGENGDTGS